MKKTFLLIALFLCAGLTVQAQLIRDSPIEINSQIQDINAPSGTISITCSEYTNNVNRAWSVNIGQNKKVKIEYYIDTEANYDKVSVYSINTSGAATLLFTESGRRSGTRYSEFMTGKIHVVFTSDASISCATGYPQYTGFNLSFSAGDPIVAEAISGNLQGGALRVQTDYGNLDLGPQNATTAHLSTDRSQFLLNKPLFLQTGTLSSYNTSNMYFQTNGTNRMTVLNSNGNVGIGTTSPAEKLEINGSLKAANRIYMAGGHFVFCGGTDGNGVINFGSKGNLYFRSNPIIGSPDSNPTELMILKSNGDLGIGITDPIAKLDVRGNTYISGNVGIGITSPSQKLDVNGGIRIYGAGDTGSPIVIHNGDKIQAGQAKEWKIWNMTGTTYGNSLQFWAYDQTGCSGGLCASRLTLMDNGNVGIGTTNPGVKLDVNGVIRAHEVKVCLSQGCDYVFADDYSLMSLNDLDNFIKTNKHLPDVVPAAEMETEGINLSEMNALLLKKVEELTLYVIQQQQEINLLKEKILQK
ncbi:MAG: hypothetical protein LBI82_02180 [Dysgonamonadaceae bacterium]|nr:hypothetical protein [Dysgonamonadaceae bacterium]